MTGGIPVRRGTALLALALLLHAGSAGAEAFKLELPVDCLGSHCWIARYVDDDPAKASVRDYGCGRAALDGDTGMDIALHDQKEMISGRGGSVFAAAPGKVTRVRDGMEDASVVVLGPEKVKGKECGNAVTLDHGDGWETEYCHLLKGSLAVVEGETVAVGAPLGMIGISGAAEFPHLHFEVRKNKKIVDPFLGPTPPTTDAACGVGEGTLWSKAALAAMPYAPIIVYNVGLSAQAPTLVEARAGTLHARAFPKDAPVMYAWGEVTGMQPGDTLIFRITFPDGKKREAKTTLTTVPPAYLPALTTKRPGEAWQKGRYVFELTAIRPGKNGGIYIARQNTNVP